LRGKGLPNVNRYGTGDLLVNIGVYIPENLSKDEKNMMEKLADSSNVKPNATASKNFFSHFRNMFE
jgi:molecular chaperone DnaJ